MWTFESNEIGAGPHRLNHHCECEMMLHDKCPDVLLAYYLQCMKTQISVYSFHLIMLCFIAVYSSTNILTKAFIEGP